MRLFKARLDKMKEIGGKWSILRILGLNKPVFVNGIYAEDPTQPMMTTKELAQWYRFNAHELWWDNVPKSISEEKDNSDERIYRGFR